MNKTTAQTRAEANMTVDKKPSARYIIRWTRKNSKASSI